MIARFAVVVVVAVAAGVSWSVMADEQAKKPDPTADLLAKLRKPAELPRDQEMPITEFADLLDKAGVSVVVHADVTNDGPNTGPVKTPRARSLPLAAAIRHTLAPREATFLVRKGYIEIVPVSLAIKEVKQVSDEDNRLTEPLVSVIYKEKPLNEALADLAEEYDLSIVVAPQAGDNKTGFVTVRLLNIPADKAIEMIALQADLRVVRSANGFFVTGKDHANDISNEKFEREQRLADLDRSRLLPLQPPAPVPAPAPAPVPAPTAPPPPPKM